MGYILLAGGAEFGGRMVKPDRKAIELAGGFGASVSIIPAAAAPDNNHQRAGQNGVVWFKNLGAVNVNALPLIDRASADEPAVVAALHRSKMIYMLGGFPRQLAQRLAGVILIGIDEQTGMLNDGPTGQWQVYGAGSVTLYQNDRRAYINSGKPFELMP